MMKRCILLLLAVGMLLLLGCDAPQPEEENTLIRVGFSQVGSESDWRTANTASMIAALSEKNGFELLFDNAKQKQDNQFLAIRNFIQHDVDYIVVAPIAEMGWDDVLVQAREARIPVILVDRRIKVADESLYTCWVGSDFYAEGTAAISWLEQKLEETGRQDEQIRILHIEGTDGATAQRLRTKALEDAVQERENWTICADLKGDFTEAKSYEVVADFLRTGQRIDVIYSENDNMTFGAIRALNEAGITYGPDGEVMIITFDAVREALERMMDGEIDLCVECNPLQGPAVSALIHQLEEGRAYSKETFLTETTFTRETLLPDVLAQRQY